MEKCLSKSGLLVHQVENMIINPIKRKAEEISNPQLRTKIAGRRDEETSNNAIAKLDLDNAEEASKPRTRALVVREHRVAQMDSLSHASE